MPPFQSKAQQRFMFARHPKIASEFAAETKSIKNLPERKAAPKQPSIKILRQKKTLKA